MKLSTRFPKRGVALAMAFSLLIAAALSTQVAKAELDTARTIAAPLFAPPVADVLRLVEAKVDPEVIRTYIKNSATGFSLTASDIIALRERGVPDDLVVA